MSTIYGVGLFGGISGVLSLRGWTVWWQYVISKVYGVGLFGGNTCYLQYTVLDCLVAIGAIYRIRCWTAWWQYVLSTVYGVGLFGAIRDIYSIRSWTVRR